MNVETLQIEIHLCAALNVSLGCLWLNNRKSTVLLSQALCVIGSLGNLMFKLHIYRANICCEHQTSSDNLSHDSAFDRRTLLFK